MIDYRKMLLLYVAHVGDYEGTDFLGNGKFADIDGLTDEESVELAKIRDLSRTPDMSRYYDENGVVIVK